jgi:hypothetical protein
MIYQMWVLGREYIKMAIGGQSLAVNPSLRRKRMDYVTTIQGQRGRATADVIAGQQRKREAEQQKFTEDTTKTQLKNAAAKLELDKESLAISKETAKTNKRAGQIGTGISLGTLGFNTMQQKDGVLGDEVPTGGGTWGQGIGAGMAGAGVGSMVNTSKPWKKAAVGAGVGGILGFLGKGSWGGAALGAIGGSLGGFL